MIYETEIVVTLLLLLIGQVMLLFNTDDDFSEIYFGTFLDFLRYSCSTHCYDVVLCFVDAEIFSSCVLFQLQCLD